MDPIRNYQLLELIGRGGQSEVYRALGAGGKEVAIKVLRQKQKFDMADLARFEREINIAEKTAHPGVTRIIEVVREDNRLCIVMELLKGESLQQHLVRRGTLRYSEFEPVLAQIIQILEFCHQNGVIHRDIKPQNIFLLGSGEVKIIDFGISKFTGAATGVTESGLVIGTPNYMAPERFFTSISDARSDIFSVGVLIFKVLTGEYPHSADDLLRLATSKAVNQPKRLSSLVPGIPGWLDKMVHKMLQPLAIQRYQTLTDLRIDFDAQHFFEPGAARKRVLECVSCRQPTATDFGFCFHCGADFAGSGQGKQGNCSIWVTDAGGRPQWPEFLRSIGCEPVKVRVNQRWRKLLSEVPPVMAGLIVEKAWRFGITARTQPKGIKAYFRNFPALLGAWTGLALLNVPLIFGVIGAAVWAGYKIHWANGTLQNHSPFDLMLDGMPFVIGFSMSESMDPSGVAMFCALAVLGIPWAICSFRLAGLWRKPALGQWAANNASFFGDLMQTKNALRKMKSDESRSWVKKTFDVYQALHERTPATQKVQRQHFRSLYDMHLRLLLCHDSARRALELLQQPRAARPGNEGIEQLLRAEDSYVEVNNKVIALYMLVEGELRKQFLSEQNRTPAPDLAGQLAELKGYVDAYQGLLQEAGRAA